jgi:hypothetical protein
MAKYVVEQMAHVWFRVEVEAENEDFAREDAEELLMNGEGVMNSDWEFVDVFWVMNEDTKETWSVQ